jgi:hypothetical protein
MKLQIDIPPHLNKALKIEKAQNDVASLQDMILFILSQRYEVNNG